jgi:hypothetical protein
VSRRGARRCAMGRGGRWPQPPGRVGGRSLCVGFGIGRGPGAAESASASPEARARTRAAPLGQPGSQLLTPPRPISALRAGPARRRVSAALPLPRSDSLCAAALGCALLRCALLCTRCDCRALCAAQCISDISAPQVETLSRTDAFRVAIEALTIEAAAGKLFSLSPAGTSDRTSAVYKEMRYAGADRRQEVMALIKVRQERRWAMCVPGACRRLDLCTRVLLAVELDTSGQGHPSAGPEWLDHRPGSPGHCRLATGLSRRTAGRGPSPGAQQPAGRLASVAVGCGQLGIPLRDRVAEWPSVRAHRLGPARRMTLGERAASERPLTPPAERCARSPLARPGARPHARVAPRHPRTHPCLRPTCLPSRCHPHRPPPSLSPPRPCDRAGRRRRARDRDRV